MENLKDLKMVLEAIALVRKQWILELSGKTLELLRDNPNSNFDEMLNDALMHPEIQERYQSLINLYAIVGSNSNKYLTALGESEEKSSIKKAA